MSSSGSSRVGSPVTRKLNQMFPSTFTEKNTAAPDTNTPHVRPALPFASLSVVTANATATASATHTDHVVPCSATYFMFSAVTLKYEGTSQKAVNPYAITGITAAGKKIDRSCRVTQKAHTISG